MLTYLRRREGDLRARVVDEDALRARVADLGVVVSRLRDAPPDILRRLDTAIGALAWR